MKCYWCNGKGEKKLHDHRTKRTSVAKWRCLQCNGTGETIESECCKASLTEYDKGNGEKYLACYRCYGAVNPNGTKK